MRPTQIRRRFTSTWVRSCRELSCVRKDTCRHRVPKVRLCLAPWLGMGRTTANVGMKKSLHGPRNRSRNGQHEHQLQLLTTRDFDVAERHCPVGKLLIAQSLITLRELSPSVGLQVRSVGATTGAKPFPSCGWCGDASPGVGPYDVDARGLVKPRIADI